MLMFVVIDRPYGLTVIQCQTSLIDITWLNRAMTVWLAIISKILRNTWHEYLCSAVPEDIPSFSQIQ